MKDNVNVMKMVQDLARLTLLKEQLKSVMSNVVYAKVMAKQAKGDTAK